MTRQLEDRLAAVAVHEAAHVEVARARGAGSLSASVRPDGRGGAVGGWTGWAGDDFTAVDEAVALLAGCVAEHHTMSRVDLPEARALLRGTDVSLTAARRMARADVRRLRGKISQTAEGLLS